MKNKINQNIKAAILILVASFMIVVMNMFTPAYIVALLGAVSPPLAAGWRHARIMVSQQRRSVEGPGLPGYEALQRQAPHGSLRRAESLDR